jgi:tRNA (mo5U34)-methyltransferase
MTPTEIRTFLTSSRYWYHIIELGDGIKTPGHEPLIPLWELIRRVRIGIDYKDARVLDLASMDGMWAFEAEKLGAKQVIATDCCEVSSLENLLFCRNILQSNVLPFFNVSPYNVFERLDTYFDDIGELFDIVHHTGLLYHVRDPLFTLSQARSCLRFKGTLLLETAISLARDHSMVFNGPQKRIYQDITTWWAPTLPALIEMLQLSFFEVDEASIQIMNQTNEIGRVCLVAKAIGLSEHNGEFYGELLRSSRNPGFTPYKRFNKKPLMSI